MKKIKSMEEMEKRVAKMEYFGDFVIVAGVPYQIVEYSMQSVGGGRKGGSSFVKYYNPFTGNEISLDYEEGTAEIDKTFIQWEKDMSLDLKYLKKRFK